LANRSRRYIEVNDIPLCQRNAIIVDAFVRDVNLHARWCLIGIQSRRRCAFDCFNSRQLVSSIVRISNIRFEIRCIRFVRSFARSSTINRFVRAFAIRSRCRRARAGRVAIGRLARAVAVRYRCRYRCRIDRSIVSLLRCLYCDVVSSSATDLSFDITRFRVCVAQKLRRILGSGGDADEGCLQRTARKADFERFNVNRMNGLIGSRSKFGVAIFRVFFSFFFFRLFYFILFYFIVVYYYYYCCCCCCCCCVDMKRTQHVFNSIL
jgi:hypothetical protein